MKKTLVWALLTPLIASVAFSAEIATARNGKKVILYDNGTWEYRDKEQRKPNAISETNSFFDNPAKFKGKTVKAKMMYADDRFLELRSGQGRDLKFYADTYCLINVPSNIKVPNIGFSTPVVVTFICNEGSTRSGNVALEIVRDQH